MATQNPILDVMDDLIQRAKAEGATSVEDLIAQLEARWNFNPDAKAHPVLDQWGRMNIAGHWMFCPFPISEKWELTQLQRNNISANCGVDALGRWQWTDDSGTLHKVPSAFSGFSDKSPISYLPATRWEIVKNPDGTVTSKSMGYFPEYTLKTRFANATEATNYKYQA